MNRLIFKIVFSFLLFFIASGFSAEDQTPPPLADFRTPSLDASQPDRYAGQGPAQLISLNFTNIKVRELLQIIAQFTKLNFVITDQVKGDMSIHLHQVPWTQALDVILKSQNLGERRIKTVVYIAPVAILLGQQIEELEAKQRVRDLVPLEDRIIHLNYANAPEIQKILDTKNYSLLSARGSTNVDLRTNSVWVRDTPEHVKTIAKLIKELDHPVQQVMIEARIVSVKQRYERALGARFGLTGVNSDLNMSGTIAGANSLAGGSTVSAVTVANRLNFNNPAAPSSGTPGSIGMAVTKLGSAFVDLELSALSLQNDISIISSPQLITSNQQTAYIQTGEEIPYQNATSSGATAIAFANAVLKLDVTPQITPDNRVILNLTVTNDSAGTPVVSGGGTAIPINTEEEKSNILLNNNETVVLGGVYKRKKSNAVQRIPFLGRLPLIGHLFSNTDRIKDDNELLIFLTPHIIRKPSDIGSTT